MTRREVLAAFAASAVSARGAEIESLRERLPRTHAQLAAAPGAGQLYLSRRGEVLADVAWGKTASGAAVTPATLVAWASAVKPLTAVAFLKLWDRGKFDLDDKVTRLLPEFGANGKEDVKIRHLLTHTAHLGGYPGPQALHPDFAVNVKRILDAPRTAARPNAPVPAPGNAPGYNPPAFFVLAEICRRLYGRSFDEVIRREVFEPCGMPDSWCGMPRARHRAYREQGRLGIFASRGAAAPEAAGETVATTLASEDGAALIQPAGGGYGPTRELARFYEMMLRRGRDARGKQLLSPQAVEAMITPKTPLGVMGMWGLAFNVAIPENIRVPAELGGERLQHRYGRFASPRTFGHPGASGMQACADPEHGLAIAFLGRPALFDAIYQDLGLAR